MHAIRHANSDRCWYFGLAGTYEGLKRTMPERRFPPPWSVEELDAWFVAKDNSGQKLSYVHFEEDRFTPEIGAVFSMAATVPISASPSDHGGHYGRPNPQLF